jgi:hypothetical protein
MARNPQLFPTDFPTTLAGVGSEEFALENAVTTVQRQARDTAVRQAHTRRIGGQNSIGNQNKLVSASPLLMPLHQIGSIIQAIPFLGTAAYLGGGRGHGSTFSSIYRLPFSNETFNPLGVRLTDNREYAGTVGDASSGRFCGGFSNKFGTTVASLDEFTYLKESVQRLAVQLSQARLGLAGGIGDKVKGLLLGGVADGSSSAVRTGDRLTYATNTISGLGNFLAVNRFAPHNGTCNKFSGYVYGGSPLAFSGNPLFSVERVTLSTEALTTIGTTLAHAHVVHGACGNDIKGYLAGGNTNPPATWNWFTNTITAFTYSGETSAPLAATLTEGKVCVDGTGSSIAGYFVAGDTATSNWQGTTTADKLTYSNESTTRLGAQLSQPQADQGAVSDYGAGFSY